MIRGADDRPDAKVLVLPRPLAVPTELAAAMLGLRALCGRAIDAGVMSRVRGEAIGVYDFGRGSRPLARHLSLSLRGGAPRRRRTFTVDHCELAPLVAELGGALGRPLEVPAVSPREHPLWIEPEDRRSFLRLRRAHDAPRTITALDLQLRALAELCCGRAGRRAMRARASVRLILDVVLYLDEHLAIRQESDLYLQARCTFVAADVAANDEPRRGHHVETFRALPDFEALRRVIAAAEAAYDGCCG